MHGCRVGRVWDAGYARGREMDGLDELEEYLRTARVTEVCTFPATTGGAHPKALVILEGGVGVLASRQTQTPTHPRWCREKLRRGPSRAALVGPI